MNAAAIPLEDNIGDLANKAWAGLHIQPETSEAAGLYRSEWVQVSNGEADAALMRRAANLLELEPEAFAALAHPENYPPPPAMPDDGFAHFNMPYNPDGSLTVNNYLIWDSATGDAALFDAGAPYAPRNAPSLGATQSNAANGETSPALEFIQKHRLNLRDIFISHTHPDHIGALDALLDATHATAHADARERRTRAVPFDTGAMFRVGRFAIECRDASGHSPGQTAYVVNGFARTVAFCGDALFAGSMGGTIEHYQQQRTNTLEQILSLPGDTILACGHGPLTTVAIERRHNPVFAGFFKTTENAAHP